MFKTFRSIASVFLTLVGFLFLIFLVRDPQLTEPYQIAAIFGATILLVAIPIAVAISMSANRLISSIYNIVGITVIAVVFGSPTFWTVFLNHLPQILFATILFGITWLAITVVTEYNSLSHQDETINKMWSNIQVFYQKRMDEIGTLTKEADKYMVNERGLLNEITAARSGFVSLIDPEQKIKEIDKLEKSSAQFALNLENYPELKSNQTTMQLMTEISKTETQLSTIRLQYNDSVINLNQKLRTFPFSLFSTIFGLHKREYFQAEMTKFDVIQ